MLYPLCFIILTHICKTKYATTLLSFFYFSLFLWKRSTPELKLLLAGSLHFPPIKTFHSAFTASRPDCSRYYTLGIAPIIFSFGLLLIFYLNLGNSCSDTFNEDSCIFCRSRPLWHSATWPLVWLHFSDYFILLCLLPALWPR